MVSFLIFLILFASEVLGEECGPQQVRIISLCVDGEEVIICKFV